MSRLPQVLRGVVYARDEWACVRCGQGHGLSVHHRRPRGMGGTSRPEIHAMANLLTLCGDGTRGCHGWVESNRTEATRLGFLCPSWQDPADWPVNRGGDRWELPGETWTATEPHSVQTIPRGAA